MLAACTLRATRAQSQCAAHPTAQSRFRRAQEAWDVLREPQARAAYDEALAAASQQTPTRVPPYTVVARSETDGVGDDGAPLFACRCGDVVSLDVHGAVVGCPSCSLHYRLGD